MNDNPNLNNEKETVVSGTNPLSSVSGTNPLAGVSGTNPLLSANNNNPVPNFDVNPSHSAVPATSPVVSNGPLTSATSVNPRVSKAPPGNIRYNPVTGEEIDLNKDKDAVNNDEKLKTVEVEAKPQKKGSTFLLIFFFIFLLLFVIFLPNLQIVIDSYLSGRGREYREEILNGKLICTIDTNTVNLDRHIERVFYYTDLKLDTAKFTTIVRGDITEDEEALDELNTQCTQIKEMVNNKVKGITVDCELLNGQLTEKESFNYAEYDFEAGSAAYTEAGGTLLEFSQGQDIDSIMKNMRQGGFDCKKEQ